MSDKRWKKYECRYDVQISDGDSAMRTTSTKAITMAELEKALEEQLAFIRKWRASDPKPGGDPVVTHGRAH